MTNNECRCGKPTRDAAYVCDNCADGLSKALGDIPWLATELEVTITRQAGQVYTGMARSSETPSPVNWGASEARSHLKALLVSWARFCDAEAVRNASPHPGLPEDNLTALSRWMLWRVDGLTLHDIGPEAVDEITDAVAHCNRLVDRPADRQYLGRCQECDEVGSLYGKPGSVTAKCDVCGCVERADQIRERLLKELDDRLCTAAEIAHLSTYLGLKAGRDVVRKRINQWSARGQLEQAASFSDEPTFRFGTVYEKLVKAEYGVKQAG